ncbi:MAG: response regulator [Steroidobacteraceae bacterium]
MLLQLEGHEAHTAYSAAEAIETAETLQPKVMFLDIGLPHSDGYEVARQIRSAANGRAPRLIALTGYGQPEDIQRS